VFDATRTQKCFTTSDTSPQQTAVSTGFAVQAEFEDVEDRRGGAVRKLYRWCIVPGIFGILGEII
jgi:hypothetical protein